ncbi:MAG: DMT family transporter [Candidatus Puniceispirillaceae bacterium]|jgi:drug/metabolite transporter (DMT)-like permease
MISIFTNLPAQTRATCLMIVALFMFTVMGICIRLSAAHLPVIEVVFFRNFLAVLILLPLVARVGFGTLRMQRPKLFFLRAAINAVGMFCGFTALTLIPLAQMTALSFTTPLFVTIGAVLFLGEVIRARRIAAISIGFLGTLIILQPGVVDVTFGALLALISALTIAMASLIVKTLTRSESQHAIVTWMVVMQAPLALIPSLWVWQWPDLLTWGFLWGMALSGTIAHLCFTRAFSLVDITALQPLEFIKLPFAVILAWIIFAEWPGLSTFVGGAVIFASTVYITRREAAARQSLRPTAGPREPRL